MPFHKSTIPDGLLGGLDHHPSVVLFGSMGNLICGFSREDLTQVFLLEASVITISDFIQCPLSYIHMTDMSTLQETAKYLLPIFGSHMGHCSNPTALSIMATKAVQVYGSVESWRPSLVRGLGLIPAGLPPSALDRLTAEQKAALHPAVAAAAQLDPLDVIGDGHGHGHGHGHDHSGENSGAFRHYPNTPRVYMRRYQIGRGDLVLFAAFIIMKILFYGAYAVEQICILTGDLLTVCVD